MSTDWSCSEFVRAERRRGLAVGSIDKRVGIVRRYLDHVGDPWSASWRDVEAFVDGSDMRAATSRYAAVSHLHAFYRWAQREGLTRDDPTIIVERPRIPPALPRPVHDTDLALALTVAAGPVRVAVLLAALCGLRCVEVARLRWIDVGVESVRVRGKRDRERVIPLPVEVRVALDELDRVGEFVLDGWQGADRAPGARVSHRVGRFLRSIGVDATAHQLRHWCASSAYRATGDLGAVQDYLGHASPATTRIYAQLDPSRLSTVAAAMASPRLSAV